jgi:hypothetical protein
LLLLSFEFFFVSNSFTSLRKVSKVEKSTFFFNFNALQIQFNSHRLLDFMFKVENGTVVAVKSPYGESQKPGSGTSGSTGSSGRLEVFDRALKNPFEDPNESFMFGSDRAEFPTNGFK